MVVGHALEMSFTNLKRLVWALFPLSKEQLDEVFRDGIRDANKFLYNHPGSLAIVNCNIIFA